MRAVNKECWVLTISNYILSVAKGDGEINSIDLTEKDN
jgi:hypothetical protein